jgi:RNAse (barnase) inhibitor barstar
MLGSFFDSFFGIDIQAANLDRVDFPTFEECLGILELALNRQESFKNFSLMPNKPDIQRLREALIFLIAIILNNKLRGRSQYHGDLVRRLKNEHRLKKTTFISSNYDILIDNALIDLFEESIDLDYELEFTNFTREKNWTRPRPRRAVKLFKIHGSLNWLYCPTCTSLTLTPKDKRAATLVFRPEPCPSCDTHMTPIIIPPTFFKVMSNLYLQEVWKMSEEHLKHARRIFFCGYSFPDADIHVKYLLKRAELNLQTPPEVFVINNHEGKTEHEKNEEKRRFERFFKDKQRIRYTDLSFQEFCRQGLG